MVTTKDEEGKVITVSLRRELLVKIKFIQSLPSEILLFIHSRIEQEHLAEKKNKRLQRIHSLLFLELELRDIGHFDTDESFFTPSDITIYPGEPLGEDDRVKLFNKFRRGDRIG